VTEDVCGCNLSIICSCKRLKILNVPSLYPATIDRIVDLIFIMGLVEWETFVVGTIELSHDVKQVTF
jgi:hypothetical protein